MRGFCLTASAAILALAIAGDANAGAHRGGGGHSAAMQGRPASHAAAGGYRGQPSANRSQAMGSWNGGGHGGYGMRPAERAHAWAPTGYGSARWHGVEGRGGDNRLFAGRDGHFRDRDRDQGGFGVGVDIGGGYWGGGYDGYPYASGYYDSGPGDYVDGYDAYDEPGPAYPQGYGDQGGYYDAYQGPQTGYEQGGYDRDGDRDGDRDDDRGHHRHHDGDRDGRDCSCGGRY